jgi:hypothetical protein
MGVVMWEMFTLQVPFQELTAQQILMGLMQVRSSSFAGIRNDAQEE